MNISNAHTFLNDPDGFEALVEDVIENCQNDLTVLRKGLERSTIQNKTRALQNQTPSWISFHEPKRLTRRRGVKKVGKGYRDQRSRHTILPSGNYWGLVSN